MTEHQIDELFATTLTGEYDDEDPWAAVGKLRMNGNQLIFEKASAWCQSLEPLKRARAADILCQLRAPKSTEQEEAKKFGNLIFVQDSFQLLLRMIEQETDERALESELHGLGHLRQDGAVSVLVSYATHASEDVRFAVACSLGSFSNDPMAVETLMLLSEDTDDDIRNWALFALASQSDADSPVLRELFVRHLSDSNSDAQEEAIAGLAKRQDPRAAVPLLRLMESGSFYSHHQYEFAALVGENHDSKDWGTEDFIDALYIRFPHLPPIRNTADSNSDPDI
jgi:hypothetical protein